MKDRDQAVAEKAATKIVVPIRVVQKGAPTRGNSRTRNHPNAHRGHGERGSDLDHGASAQEAAEVMEGLGIRPMLGKHSARAEATPRLGLTRIFGRLEIAISEVLKRLPLARGPTPLTRTSQALKRLLQNGKSVSPRTRLKRGSPADRHSLTPHLRCAFAGSPPVERLRAGVFPLVAPRHR